MPTTHPPPECLFTISHLQIKPEFVSQFLEALDVLLLQSASEEGIIRYEFLQSRDDPTHFTFVDYFRDEAAYQFHVGTDHIRRFGAQISSFLAASPVSDYYTALEIFDRGLPRASAQA